MTRKKRLLLAASWVAVGLTAGAAGAAAQSQTSPSPRGIQVMVARPKPDSQLDGRAGAVNSPAAGALPGTAATSAGSGQADRLASDTAAVDRTMGGSGGDADAGVGVEPGRLSPLTIAALTAALLALLFSVAALAQALVIGRKVAAIDRHEAALEALRTDGVTRKGELESLSTLVQKNHARLQRWEQASQEKVQSRTEPPDIFADPPPAPAMWSQPPPGGPRPGTSRASGTDRFDDWAASPAPPMGARADFSRCLADFNRFAAAGDPSLGEQFAAAYRPSPAQDAGPETLSLGLGGELWFVRDPAGGSEGILLPSAEVVRRWEKLFVAMGGQQAKISFGPYFEVRAGKPLEVIQPARAVREGDRVRLVTKGVLQGI